MQRIKKLWREIKSVLCPRVEFNERKQLQSPQCSYRGRRCSAPDEFCIPFDLSPTLELIFELQAIRSISPPPMDNGISLNLSPTRQILF